VISQALATVTLADLAQIYDGSAKLVTATTSPEGLTVEFTYDGLLTPPTNAGNYAVTGTVSDVNFVGSGSATLVVSQAVAVVTLGDLAQIYDGSARIVSATTTPEGLTVEFTYEGLLTPPTNAGSYAVTGTVSDVNFVGSGSATLVVSQAVAVVTLSDLAQIYDGTEKQASATSVPSGLNVEFTYDGGLALPTNAGRYAVTGTVNDVNFAGVATGSLVIVKAAASVVLGDLAQTYDGTPKQVSATTTPEGLTLAFTYDGGLTAPTNAGDYAVTGMVSDLNYEGSTNGTLVIAKAEQLMTFNPIADATFGSPAFTLVATSSSGLTSVFSLVSGPASVSGSQITLTGLGEVVVQADQAGDANWLPAPPAQATFRVVAGDFSQGYVWAKGFGEDGYDTAYAVAANATGEAYVFGDFEKTVSFGESTFAVTGNRFSDLVLLKLNGDGSMAWARQYGAANSDFAKAAVALPSGGVVAGGEFYTATTVGTTNLLSAGGKDIVLISVDAGGTHQWARRFGGSSSDSLHAMAVDSNGNIYVAGQFSGSIDFGATALTSSGGSDGFVAKLDANGSVLWARKLGGTSTDVAYALAVRPTGEVVIAGSFRGGASFGSIVLSSIGGNDAFVAVLDSEGVFLWAKRFGGTTADNARAVACDETGNLWVSGSFTGLSASGFDEPPLASAGAEDVFVVRLTIDGTLLELKRYGGSGSETALSLAADPFGTMMMAGSFQQTVGFGPSTLVSEGFSDAYVAKLRAGTGAVWAMRGGGGNDDRSQVLSVNPAGEVFQAGVFNTSANFGSHSITNGGQWDMFVAKINGPVPSFTVTFSDIMVDQGDPWALSTGTLGAAPVAFQWYRDGAPVSGAVSNAYGVAVASTNDSGVYILVASNVYGAAASAPVTVTVRVPAQILSILAPATAAENETIEVPVYLDSLGDVTGLAFLIPYDKAYLMNPSFESGPQLVPGFSSVTIDENAGTVRIIGSAFPSSFPLGPQWVGTLRFTVRSVPAGASLTLTPELLSISDVFGSPIVTYTKLTSAAVALSQRLIPGDANNNGRLDVSDVAELIRLYSNPALIRAWDHTLNDLNGDSSLTEGDATRVLRVVAELDSVSSFPTKRARLLSKGSDRMGKDAQGSARLVVTRLTGPNANKVLAQVVLDEVPVDQAGLSFRVDYPEALMRITGGASLIIPFGGLPVGATPQWNVFPGNSYSNQSGRLSFASAWGSAWTFGVSQSVANIVFELQDLNSAQVHFPLTLSATEVGPYNATGPSLPLALSGQVATFSRSYADWALATLGDANADPDGDDDHDGQSNGREFASATHPLNATSVLEVTTAELGPADFTLRWFAVYAVDYWVTYSFDLASWTEIPSSRVTGTNGIEEWSEPVGIASNTFYRIEVIEP
jgi:hypothetical protein